MPYGVIFAVGFDFPFGGLATIGHAIWVVVQVDEWGLDVQLLGRVPCWWSSFSKLVHTLHERGIGSRVLPAASLERSDRGFSPGFPDLGYTWWADVLLSFDPF